MKIFTKYLTTPLGVISGFLVLLLALLTVVDVSSRYFTGRSVPGAIEYAEVVLVICVFFAFGAAQTTDTHVSTSVLTEKLPLIWRKIVTYFAAGVSTLLIIALVFATFQEFWHSYSTGEYRFGLVQVPIWPAKAAVALGMVVYLYEFVRSYFFTPELFTRETTIEDEIRHAL